MRIRQSLPPGGEGAEQVEGLPHLEAVGERGLLELAADPAAELLGEPLRVKAQDPDAAAVGAPQSLQAFHRGGLAGTVAPEQAEDLPLADLERHVLHGHVRPVAFPEVVHLDDRFHRAHLLFPGRTVASGPVAVVTCGGEIPGPRLPRQESADGATATGRPTRWG
jgi:hypothetical protein